MRSISITQYKYNIPMYSPWFIVPMRLVFMGLKEDLSTVIYCMDCNLHNLFPVWVHWNNFAILLFFFLLGTIISLECHFVPIFCLVFLVFLKVSHHWKATNESPTFSKRQELHILYKNGWHKTYTKTEWGDLRCCVGHLDWFWNPISFFFFTDLNALRSKTSHLIKFLGFFFPPHFPLCVFCQTSSWCPWALKCPEWTKSGKMSLIHLPFSSCLTPLYSSCICSFFLFSSHK